MSTSTRSPSSRVLNVSSVGMSNEHEEKIPVWQFLRRVEHALLPGVGIPVPFGLFFTFQGTLSLGVLELHVGWSVLTSKIGQVTPDP
jgi:hypothetical protein